MHTARSVTIEIADGGRYFTKQPIELRLNGEPTLTTEKTITSLFDLKPDQKYVVEAYVNGEKQGEVSFKTDYEYVTLDVTRFGAKGDGEHDDTHFIQAAIMACPVNSRVYFPAGTYRITSLFLKSHIRIELAEGAELKAFTDREKFPTFPGMLQSYDETDEYNLGTWEGNPLPMFSGIICGIGAEDVVIYGQGKINGNASKENWWKDPKVMNIAFRPRLFFISGCKNVTLQGVTFCNSPSWTLHPYFSNDLKFIGVTVQNPSDSPNTDGLDPESCKMWRSWACVSPWEMTVSQSRAAKSTWAKAQDSFREHPHPPVPDGERSRCCNSGQRDGRRRGESDGGGLHFPSYGQRPAYQDPPRQRKRCDSKQHYFPESDPGSCDDTARGQLLLFLRSRRQDHLCPVQRCLPCG